MNNKKKTLESCAVVNKSWLTFYPQAEYSFLPLSVMALISPTKSMVKLIFVEQGINKCRPSYNVKLQKEREKEYIKLKILLITFTGQLAARYWKWDILEKPRL